MSGSSEFRSRPTIAAYACLCTSLVLVVLLGIGGAVRDLQLMRSTLLNAEVARQRSHATRRAGHLEAGLEREVEADWIDWQNARESNWLKQYWRGVKLQSEGQLYSAIVDRNARIVMHTDPAAEERQLTSHWYERAIAEAGKDIVETRDEFLTGGQAAYDIQVPLLVGDQHVGSYHEGLAVSFVEQQYGALRGRILLRWSLVIGGILFVVGLSFLSLIHIVRRKSQMRQLADVAELRRISEIGQLAAGLAHEIRNPLHAIQLNLHAFRRVLDGRADLEEDEVKRMIGQSSKEVERVDHLLTELLGFASPTEARNEPIDLKVELEATLDFIEQELMHNKLELATNFPTAPLRVTMDPARFRQVVLNLLMNAQDAVDEGGRINVVLRRRSGRAEIIVADDGPGVSDDDQQRIFEPFYSTKDSGSGLGLALVKRFVEEANGDIHCESNGTGARFRVSLPLSRKDGSGSHSPR